MTTKQKVSRIEKSIALQRRTLANLEAMDIADNGSTKDLTRQIICKLEASRKLLVGTCPVCGDGACETKSSKCGR